MTDMTHLIQTIEALTPNELVQIEGAVQARRQQFIQHGEKDPQKLLALIDEVFDDFWEDMSPEDIQEAINAMNEDKLC